MFRISHLLFLSLTFSTSVVLLNGTQAAADVIVFVPDISLSEGGTGFADVLVSTSDGDNLAFASYEFEVALGAGSSSVQITGIDGGVAGSEFGNYVFSSSTDHIGQELDPSSSLPGTTFIASDSLLLDPGLMPVDRLLTRIYFQHVVGPGGAGSAVGDTFSITLLDLGNTRFEDDGFNELNIAASSFNAGTITISAAAVPEPGSIFLFLVGAIGWCGQRFCRRETTNC